MADFRTEARGPRPFIGALVEVQFPDEAEPGDGAFRAWNGALPIVTGDGRVWRPLHELARVGEIETGSALEAPGMSLEVVIPGSSTGMEEGDFIALLEAFVADVDLFGCLVRIYGLGLALGPSSVEVSGDPVAVYVGQITHPETAWADVRTVIARLYAEDPMAFAREAPNARYTGTDQRARHPGDTFCDFVGTLAARKVHFPPQKTPS